MRKTCVCVCLDAGWCMVSTFKRLKNRLDLFMNIKTESKMKQLSA